MDVKKKITDVLLNRGRVWAPTKVGSEVEVKLMRRAQEIDWSGRLPVNSFKTVFLPPHETLVKYSGLAAREVSVPNEPRAALGVNILDLQAYTLLTLVFEKDPYFQKNRRRTLVVGHSASLPADFRKQRAFHMNYEENVLEHVVFDVFIESGGAVSVYSGSAAGQKFLEQCGVPYEHIEFAGPMSEQGKSSLFTANEEAVAGSRAHKLWDELAEICLACGKCSLVCPTCYCHDHYGEADLREARQERRWANCFYPEFSKIAGGGKDLDSIKKRLYFWYYHKFVRVPRQYDYFGCVGCGRCTKVCPAGIDIMKNLQNLKHN